MIYKEQFFYTSWIEEPRFNTSVTLLIFNWQGVCKYEVYNIPNEIKIYNMNHQKPRP